MAATIAGKGDDSSAEGESKTSVPLKAAESQTSKTFMDSEKINAKTVDSKKEEQVVKKFVDAPLPATNAWAKRSTSETSQAQAMNLDTKQDAAVNEKISSQDDSIKNTSDKTGNGSSTSPEKITEERPKTDKSATDLSSSKQAIADNSHKKKIKMFGDDFIEAPPPAINPWKKASDAGLSLAPFGADQAQALTVMSPVTNRKCVTAAEHYYTAETNKKDKEPENVTDETVPTKDVSPVLADESWPTLHEVKVTEPNQTIPAKATKPAKVKESPQTPATAAVVVNPEVPASTSDSHAAKSEETKLLPDESPVRKPPETEKTQVQARNDSGGDDSSKENKESATLAESNKTTKGKKGSKPKWQKMEIDHPKPDRRNRRSRSQGRENSPRRRDGRRAGDRFNKTDSRRSDAGPESQNWRANMVSQTAAAAAASANTVEDAHEEKNKSFPAGRSRGRGGERGTSRGGRRGGGRGRGAARDAKSPPFHAGSNDWHQPEQNLPAPESIEAVPWSQGFNQVHTVPRVPPILPQVMMGMDTNFYIQEQILNVLGSPPVFYESDSTTYPPETLKHQIEYYFSEDNLVKDLFLRKKMDKQGWVKIELVLSFKKMKELKADHDNLIQVIRSSNKLELSEKEEFVRTLNSPESWPIEEDFKGLPPPPAVQRVAAMSTLHSDAPEFVPGKPFVLRSLVSDVSGSIPDGDNTLDSGVRWTPEDKENDNILQDTASNLPTISPILSSS